MEGDGEGVVAVVQRLRGAGLAVTLMGSRPRRRASSTALKHPNPVSHARSSVETRAGAWRASTADAAAQICDDRYTSSYQLAHCRARPSSPPIELAEFPPQRLEPCHTQGNFEIGGIGSGEAKAPIYASQPMRSSFTCVDRGVLSPARSSRGTEAFAHSLRRYPSVSPNRSISTELVQRLLAYTQAKNFTKSSYHSKSLRSLRNKLDSPKETPKTKSTKGVQTYTRHKSGKENVPIKEECREKIEKQEKGRKKRAQSPVRSARDIRYKASPLNSTYDYLKSPHRYSVRGTDVRYLSDVTRCLRDTLRQICDDRPVVCPNIQSRYSRHRREHHGCANQGNSHYSNMDGRASVPMVSTGVPAMSSCEAIPGAYQQTSFTPPKVCCICRRPLPCSCTPRSSVQFQDSPTILSKECSIDSNIFARTISRFKDERFCVCSKSEDDFENSIRENVLNWLQEVPVYANENPNDRAVREDMAKQLVEKLKSLKDREDFEGKAEAEIAECVSNMPMWCPGNKEDQDAFKQQIINSLLNKIRNISLIDDKFGNEISKWVDSLNFQTRDSQSHIIDKKDVVNNLINRLQPLALNQSPNADDYKKELKTEIVDILEELPITIDGERNKYLNRLADKLTNQLYKIPAKDISKQSSIDSLQKEIQKQIWEWLKDVPQFSNKDQNQKSIKALANKLQHLQDKGIEDTDVQEQMQNEINEWLENNVDKSSLNTETKNKLADKLMGKLISISKSVGKSRKPLSQDTVTNQVWDWFTEIPELASEDTKENKNIVESLAKKLYKIRSQGDDAELEGEISNWLTTTFDRKGESLDARKQSKLVNNLLSKLKSSDLKQDEQILQNIWKCFEDFAELDMTSKESQNMVKQLANKIQELQSQKQDESNEEEMKEELNDWLNNLCSNTGTKISTKTRNELMQKLLNVVAPPKPRKRWSKQTNLEKTISDEISNVLDGSSIKLANGERKDLQNKISDLLSKNIGRLSSKNGKNEVKNTITEILQQETNMSPENARKMADDILNKVQNIPIPKSGTSLQPEKLQNTLKEEVGLILDDANVFCDNRNEIESILSEVLADQVMRGEDDRHTKNKLITALKDFDISQEHAEEIASKLMNRANEMTLSHKTKDSTMQFSGKSRLREFEALPPMQKAIFQDNAEQEIVDFIQEITGDSNLLSTKKYKAAAEKLAEKVADISSDENTTTHDKRLDIESEVSKCLQSLSIGTDGSQVKLLSDKLQNLAFRTSTPKRSSLDQAVSFRPRRDSGGSIMSSIEDSYQFKMQAPSREEEQYMNKLVKIINNWISELPVDLNTKDGKGFKEVMIRDLAGDIIDRQKYLQLNPDAKTSNEEELEYLKYQVFRWLIKLLDTKELMPSMYESLMEKIKDVPVPQLIRTQDKQTNSHRDTSNITSLQNEITKWIEAVPPKLYVTKDKKKHQKMVKELAEQIDQLHNQEELTERLLNDIVSNWLQQMLKEYNEQYFSSLTEGLKGNLLNKGLISLLETSRLMKESSHIMQENLRSLIIDWLKEKSLYQKRLSIEKREQEQIVEDLSKNLKDTLKSTHPSEMHRDDKVLDEIKSHLKKFPMESHLKLNEELHHTTANDLLEYLKMMEVVENIFDIQQSQSPPEVGIEDILPVLEEWIDALPLKIRKSSAENKKLDGLKQEFAKTLHQLHQQQQSFSGSPRHDFKEEIKKYLQKLPIEPAKKKDELFVSKKIDDLNKKLQDIQSQIASSGIPVASNRQSGQPEKCVVPISVDNLKKVILNWAKALPFQAGKSIEKSKSDVNQLASKIKDLLANVDEFDKVKNNLEKEITTFVKKLPLQKKRLSIDYVNELTNNLKDFVRGQSAARPNMATDSNVSSKSAYKKAADVLYDNVEDWCENLPIESGNTPEEKERVKTIKKNVAGKLINVIGDLNVNPEIFSDDILYEELLNDEIDNVISTLPHSQDLQNNLPELKDNLIQKVMEAKHKTQDELAGQAYKQQLRYAISKTLPSVENLTIEEQAPFEVLKDNLADAFINLHYAADNEEVKSKLKNKINEEINQFCDDYLQMYPASPVDPRDLNRELYNVLQKVPVPKEETIKAQVEQVRIKDEINEWLKEIPLKENLSPAEQLQSNKIVSVLAKRLHDIEKENEFNPNVNFEERKQKEIKKWIKKLPLKPGEENNIDNMAEQLASKLKNTEESRRFSVSKIRHSIDIADEERPCENVCPFYSTLERPAPSTCNRYLSQYAPPFPPSTLSTEDRAHLERIRERNQQKQLSFSPNSPPCHCKDASVNPIPIDAESQTDIGATFDPGSAKSIQPQVSSWAPPQAPVIPQVVVKEYYWDSTDPTIQEPGYSSPCGEQDQSGSFICQNRRNQQPPESQQFPCPQSPVNRSPKVGLAQQPSPCLEAQGQYLSPRQSRMPQAPCMMSPLQPPYMPQQERTYQSPMTSPVPPMPSQVTCTSQPRIRSSPPMMSPQAARSVPQRAYPSAPPCMASQDTPMPPHAPCMMSKHSPTQTPLRFPNINQPEMPEVQSPYQYDSPYITSPQISRPQMPPCQSHDIPNQRSPPSRHIPPCHSQEQQRQPRRSFRQPCFGSPEMSSTSSPFDTECPETCNSRFSPKVTRLGSLDDVPYTKNSGSQSPKAKRSRGFPGEDYDWTIRFPDDGFWGTPCPRRRVRRSPTRSSERTNHPLVRERERKDETVRCHCRERVLTNCMGRRPQSCSHSCQQDDASMQHCSKCCGAHCPHPSYLFFR